MISCVLVDDDCVFLFSAMKSITNDLSVFNVPPLEELDGISRSCDLFWWRA